MPQSPFSQDALNELVAMELAKPQATIEAPAPTPPKKVSKWAQIATAVGAGLDTGSTIYALNKPGVEELNPIYGKHPSATKMIGIRGGLTALQMLAQDFLGKQSPKLANALGFGSGAVSTGAAIHNINAAKKASK